VARCAHCQSLLDPQAIYCSRCGTASALNGADLPLSAALAEASRLLALGQIDQAIACLTPHVDADDPEPIAAFALGTAYLQRGKYAESLPLLALTVEQLPTHALAHAYLGMAYLHTYQPAEARAELDAALALAPDDFVVNLKYGEFFLRMGYFREAIGPLEHALATTAPDGPTLEFARRLLRLAREKAPNTFTVPVHRFPTLRRLLRRPVDTADTHSRRDEPLPELR
jgi:tetratricopeptide (TPR) repeat protein